MDRFEVPDTPEALGGLDQIQVQPGEELFRIGEELRSEWSYLWAVLRADLHTRLAVLLHELNELALTSGVQNGSFVELGKVTSLRQGFKDYTPHLRVANPEIEVPTVLLTPPEKRSKLSRYTISRLVYVQQYGKTNNFAAWDRAIRHTADFSEVMGVREWSLDGATTHSLMNTVSEVSGQMRNS